MISSRIERILFRCPKKGKKALEAFSLPVNGSETSKFVVLKHACSENMSAKEWQICFSEQFYWKYCFRLNGQLLNCYAIDAISHLDDGK